MDKKQAEQKKGEDCSWMSADTLARLRGAGVMEKDGKTLAKDVIIEYSESAGRVTGVYIYTPV